MGKNARSGKAKSGRRGAYVTKESLSKFGAADIKLRQWRIFRDRMTVAELSERSGVSEGMINDLENDKGGAGLETLKKLADALDTSVGKLFDVNPLDDEEFWPLFEAADPSQRQLIREHAAIIVRKR